MFGDEAFDAAHVFRRFHERDGDPIDALLDAEREVFEIFFGHRVDRKRAVRIVDTLLRAKLAADFDARLDAVARFREDT
jgi:hypothetical protein